MQAQASAQAQAVGIAVGVIAFIGYIIALIVGLACYRKGICKKRNPHPSQMRNNCRTPVATYPLASYPSNSSNAMNRNNAYATTYVTTATPNGTQNQYQQPQHPYQPQLHSATTTSHLNANTHAGKAPPAYHAAIHCETMTLEDYKSLKLSEGSAANSAKPDSGNTDTPPTYSEIVGGQEENKSI